MKKKYVWFALAAIACLLLAPGAQAASQIQYFQTINPAVPTHAGATDYSDSGLDLGNEGFWFANFGASSPNTGPVDQNDYNSLPSWLIVVFDPNDPNYAFEASAPAAYSEGGQSSWATLTLPDGATGLSGALVDPQSTNNSNNAIKRLTLGPGAPGSFWMHVVTDNTNLAHDPVGRLRAREDADDVDVRLENLSFDGDPDVYSFLYSGMVVGDFIKMQLNSGVAGEAPSFAGLMFDLPEPASAVLLLIGGMGLTLAVRRRRG